MNISLKWFQEFGLLKSHDSRTIENVLDIRFISHAKSEASSEESAYIDYCINELRYQEQLNTALADFQAGKITQHECILLQNDSVRKFYNEVSA